MTHMRNDLTPEAEIYDVVFVCDIISIQENQRNETKIYKLYEYVSKNKVQNPDDPMGLHFIFILCTFFGRITCRSFPDKTSFPSDGGSGLSCRRRSARKSWNSPSAIQSCP